MTRRTTARRWSSGPWPGSAGSTSWSTMPGSTSASSRGLLVDEWRAIIDGNLTSAFLCARAAYPAMVAAGGGKIINVGSLAAILGLPFAAPYAASKGGMVQLTRSLATAWAKDNIQANAVLPGWIDTDLTKRARTDLPGLEARVVARTRHALGRPRRPCRASPCSWPAPPRTSSPARRYRSTAATPCRDRRGSRPGVGRLPLAISWGIWAMQVGFIGLGQMGAAMAANLLAAGHAVTVFNRTPEKAAPLEQRVARVAATIAEACHDEAVVTMLADDSAVELTVLGSEGVVANLPRGAIHVSMSTIGVALSERMAEAHGAKDQRFVAAPVFGRPDAAAAAKLFIVAAGATDSVAAAQPLFDAMGQRTFPIGERPAAAKSGQAERQLPPGRGDRGPGRGRGTGCQGRCRPPALYRAPDLDPVRGASLPDLWRADRRAAVRAGGIRRTLGPQRPAAGPGGRGRARGSHADGEPTARPAAGSGGARRCRAGLVGDRSPGGPRRRAGGLRRFDGLTATKHAVDPAAMSLEIRTMSRAELELAIDWAAAEGWNPGLADATPFHVADPAGFLIGLVDGTPAAVISVVRYGQDFGFLGFYIAAPAHRGHGHGLRLWQAGLDHLHGRTIGLDGVVAQQANYRRSGFSYAWPNFRYGGAVEGRADPGLIDARTLPFAAIERLDRALFPAPRPAFLAAARHARVSQPGIGRGR